MPPPTNGRVRKCLRRKIKKQEVLNIFQIMENQPNTSSAAGAQPGQKPGDLKNEFFNTGRVGRRNALPDILGAHCTTSTADLPDKLSGLSTDDKPSSEPGPSRLHVEQKVAENSDKSAKNSSGNS